MRRGLVMLCIALMMVTPLAGCLDSVTSNSGPSVTMSINPTGTVKVGDEVTFDATGSSDPNGDPLSFDWDFGDGNTGKGQTVKHIYNQPGTFTTELCVSDSDYDACEEKDIIVAAADAALPSADITSYKDDDCEGDGPGGGTHTLVWICEVELDSSDDTVDATTTVYLDGSESAAGDSSSYLTKYEWDLNIQLDSDNDGDPENDVDIEGESPEWTNVAPGEYEVKLTVTDNQGFTSSDEMDVYVNYRGAWAEFTIAGNTSNSPAEMTFGYPVVYNQETGHKIRYVKVQVTYPIEDDDWAVGSADNRLDLFVYNDTEEHVVNTTWMADDDQSSGDCASDDRCLEQRVSTGFFRDYLDGSWTVDLVNEKFHDTTVKSFVIILEYK